MLLAFFVLKVEERKVKGLILKPDQIPFWAVRGNPRKNRPPTPGGNYSANAGTRSPSPILFYLPDLAYKFRKNIVCGLKAKLTVGHTNLEKFVQNKIKVKFQPSDNGNKVRIALKELNVILGLSYLSEYEWRLMR